MLTVYKRHHPNFYIHRPCVKKRKGKGGGGGGGGRRRRRRTEGGGLLQIEATCKAEIIKTAE